MIPPDPAHHPGSPAIWIYPEVSQDFTVKLTFSGDGFMTPPPRLEAPRLARVVRKGLTVVELAYLTHREIPNGRRRMLASHTGRDVHRT